MLKITHSDFFTRCVVEDIFYWRRDPYWWTDSKNSCANCHNCWHSYNLHQQMEPIPCFQKKIRTLQLHDHQISKRYWILLFILRSMYNVGIIAKYIRVITKLHLHKMNSVIIILFNWCIMFLVNKWKLYLYLPICPMC